MKPQKVTCFLLQRNPPLEILRKLCNKPSAFLTYWCAMNISMVKSTKFLNVSMRKSIGRRVFLPRYFASMLGNMKML